MSGSISLGTQTPEVSLRRAHVRTSRRLRRFRPGGSADGNDSIGLVRRCRGRPRTASIVRLAIGAAPRPPGRGARALQLQELVELVSRDCGESGAGGAAKYARRTHRSARRDRRALSCCRATRRPPAVATSRAASPVSKPRRLSFIAPNRGSVQPPATIARGAQPLRRDACAARSAGPAATTRRVPLRIATGPHRARRVRRHRMPWFR